MMASPGLVHAAIAISVITTGGAMYYYVTDGGDVEVAREQIDMVKERLVSGSERLRTESANSFAYIKDVFERTRETVSKASHGAFSNKNIQLSENGDFTRTESGDGASTEVENKPRMVKERPLCHTCSGPRIWFFAEKLRLKRRFTPYPDPPRE